MNNSRRLTEFEKIVGDVQEKNFVEFDCTTQDNNNYSKIICKSSSGLD